MISLTPGIQVALLKLVGSNASHWRASLSWLEPALARKDVRWILIRGLRASQSADLLRLFEVNGLERPDWVFPFDHGRRDVRGNWLILDVLDETSATAVASGVKPFLRDYQGARLIILAHSSLPGIDLPNSWGEGLELQAPDSARPDNSSLLRHARKILPRYALDDLVLGASTQLRFLECLHYIRTREFCLETWGFRKRHSRGHGVTMLFHGESGTGKTMAAEVVAKTLNLDLYQVDLSSVMSKWVGETEKNLKSIFRSAQGIPGILLFDEGDAIFGQRTKVEQSQDRYSNLEVNYLLQEIETFDGVVILSTNHEKNMDPAFLRRFTYALNFGFPDAGRRLLMWQRNLPPEMPLGETVDFKALSGFTLSGGNIRNCIRDAAARAATLESSQVEQLHFLWAIKRELQKHGRDLDRELVGEQYWPYVATEWEYRYAPKLRPVLEQPA